MQPQWERYGDFREQSGERLGEALLALDDPPTAIFAGSDLQALGVLRAASRRGVEVPRELSVVGYDDIPLARMTSPPLTTIHQPLRRMAEEATRLVLRIRAGAEAEPTRLDLADLAGGACLHRAAAVRRVRRLIPHARASATSGTEVPIADAGQR